MQPTAYRCEGREGETNDWHAVRPMGDSPPLIGGGSRKENPEL